MGETELRDEDHVVRYVKPTLVRRNGSVDGSAFCLRSDESGLSVNWLDWFAGLSKSKQIEQIRHLSRITMKRRGRLAELNVGTAKQETREVANIRFAHQPLAAEYGHPADPSHCEIVGLPGGGFPEAAIVGDLLAKCVEGTYPGQL